MAYTGRHSYFLCFLQFVFRRSPARLAVKKYAHAKREEDFFTSNQPAGPPCGTGLKTTIFAARNEDDRLLPSIYCLSGENLDSMQLFCLWYVWRNIQGYEMRTAIRDVAEGADMGLETGSVPGLSCSLYGGVDFGEDYREVTGKSAVPEKLYVYVVPSEIRSLLKSWKTSFGSVSRYLPETKL